MPSMATRASAIRGSVASSAAFGGGTELIASHRRSERFAGSRCSSSDTSVVPVRGRPSTMIGRSIGSSRAAGCSASQATTWSRFVRFVVIWAPIAISPSSLRSASASREATNVSRPSRQPSAPKSSSPACSQASSTSRPASMGRPGYGWPTPLWPVSTIVLHCWQWGWRRKGAEIHHFGGSLQYGPKQRYVADVTSF